LVLDENEYQMTLLSQLNIEFLLYVVYKLKLSKSAGIELTDLSGVPLVKL